MNLLRTIRRYWRKLGVKLYGGFFQELFRLQLAHKKQLRMEYFWKQRMVKQGMRRFEIDGYTVWARNEKNARRKVDNLKRAK